ncbi:hypothetical protein [Chryseosolibacter indicus]|uniref:DUF3311 domain-containing protein n=1 Tax=Chryseosolibacter indicus TaxID=2782351 RepID=A0ABS5VLC0_9BACT|nr:hypothetical protein [Chryseosolibacter indicus]MBT1701906.1 hypothetical protein [Chryseosolibacter indicus]
MRKQKLIVLSMLITVLFSYPLIAIVNTPAWVAGIPLLYFYIFTTWLLCIVCILKLAEGRESSPPNNKR